MVSNHINAVCPHCKVHVTFSWTKPSDSGGNLSDYLHIHYKNKVGMWAIGECPSCKKCVLINGLEHNYEIITKNIYPFPLPSPTDKRIPEKIRRDIEEAKLSFSVKAFNASASMSRRALQRACKEKGAKKTNLIDQIDELATTAVITIDLKDLAHTVRAVGNDGAHPNDLDVDEADAKEILELAEQFMEIIFVAPAKVKEIKEKRSQLKNEK